MIEGDFNTEGLIFSSITAQLLEKGFYSILAEGGQKLNASLIDQNMADELYWFIAPKLLNDQQAVPMLGIDKANHLVNAYRLDLVDRKGFKEVGYSRLIYKRHGNYETNQFCPIKSDTYDQYGKWIPEIRANYIQGKLEGNVKIYDRLGNELFNAFYKNGILIKGINNEYSEDYNDGIYTSRLTKTSTINNNIVTWKIFDSQGDILDEGLEKIDPEKYSYDILSKKGIWNEK